jgi:hypothetical protein
LTKLKPFLPLFRAGIDLFLYFIAA